MKRYRTPRRAKASRISSACRHSNAAIAQPAGKRGLAPRPIVCHPVEGPERFVIQHGPVGLDEGVAHTKPQRPLCRGLELVKPRFEFLRLPVGFHRRRSTTGNPAMPMSRARLFMPPVTMVLTWLYNRARPCHHAFRLCRPARHPKIGKTCHAEGSHELHDLHSMRSQHDLGLRALRGLRSVAGFGRGRRHGPVLTHCAGPRPDRRSHRAIWPIGS